MDSYCYTEAKSVPADDYRAPRMIVTDTYITGRYNCHQYPSQMYARALRLVMIAGFCVVSGVVNRPRILRLQHGFATTRS